MTTTAWTWPNSKIVRVVDGDTVDALVTRDLGFGGTASFTVRLRLNRINAPAATSVAGRAARAWLKACEGAVVDITTLKPYKFGGPSTSPGEWMAEVLWDDLGVPGLGVNLSDALVVAGHAVFWDGQGPRPDDAGAAA